MPGATLILWAIGLGPTNPAIPDGEPAPASPPAVVAIAPMVRFAGTGGGNGSIVSPSFAGLSPRGVGIYQVMVTVPGDMPAGPAAVSLLYPGLNSNTVSIWVQ
jgi:uncharacterized protein (TIGR03437 family)